MESTIKTISIELLAEKLNGKFWSKGELKRIYLDEGYNTKKMSTKTYVYQNENGEFKVSCKVECPSQPWQWCKSQEDEIKENVYMQIANIISISELQLVDYILCTEGKYDGHVMVYVKRGEEEPVWMNEDAFYEHFSKYPQDVWEQVDDLLKPERERMEKLAAETAKVEAAKIEAAKTAAVFDGGGSKYSHGKFGFGLVIAEDEQTITLNFETVGVKKLLKRFVKLTKLD